MLSLVSRGVIDIPYANRPLGLLWALPVPWISPYSFAGFAILYWFYLWAMGALVYWVAIRIAPQRSTLALLAGVFAEVWAPNDLARLSTVERTLYMGITLGMMLATVCYLESWLRRSTALLICSGVLCVASGRCYEGTLAVLFFAPLLLIAAPGQASRTLRRWVLVFESFVIISMLAVVQPMLVPTGGLTYQADFPLDPRPAAVLGRLWLQYRLQFAPLFDVASAELLTGGVAVTVAIFLVGSLLLLWKDPANSSAKGRQGALCLTGLLLVTAAYGVLLLDARMDGAWRMQFLSAPGAALLLAGMVDAVAKRARQYQQVVALTLGAWVVAVGTGRTQALQQRWEKQSFYPRQMRMLSTLVDAVPDVRAGTLLLLIDKEDIWRANFGFHHAVEYLYGAHTVGLAWGKWAGMFPARFGPEGVASEPWPDVRRAWGEAPTLHRYDQVVALRCSEGMVQVLDEWPTELPPLPAGAVYRPRALILPLREATPERAVLRLSDR